MSSSGGLAEAMRLWGEGDLDGAAVLLRQIAATGDPEGSHHLARLLEERGDLEGAEAAHRSVIQSGHPVLGQHSAISLGMLLVDAGEWAAAHRVLTVASDGADFEIAALADTALVLVLNKLGDQQGALEALERARLSDSPSVAELAARLELPEFGAPDPAAAREMYELARQMDDEDAFRHLLTCGDPEIVALSAFRLYTIYADGEDYEAAREVCERAIAVGHPDHLTMAYKLLGAVLVDLGEYTESLEAYRRAAEDGRPELRLPALIEQAKVTAQLGDVETTRAIFRRVIASGNPEFAVEAHACLGQMAVEAGQYAEAIEELRAVLDAGESEWSSITVTMLGMLLDQAPGHREDVLAILRAATEHADQDAAFRAALVLEHAAFQEPLADPVEEQALQDTDAGLHLLKEGELDGARRLLRRAADSGAREQSVRAMIALAELEMAEGDLEQADELLRYVAEGDDIRQGLVCAVFLHLLEQQGDGLHPVLRAVVIHQRLGRQEGLAAYQEAAEHADPRVAAIGTVFLAQILASFGFNLSDAAELFVRAADSGDPFALSYTALIYSEVLAGQEKDEALALLRRAHADGHQALAPWVAYELGRMVGDDEDGWAEARAAYGSALDAGHAGLRFESAAALLQVLENQQDLLAACALHERVIAQGDPVQAPRNALLLGLTLLRLDEVERARAAFELVPESHDELSHDGVHARRLLGRDFGGASRALVLAGGGWVATMIAIQTAHAWQRRGEIAAADGALSVALEAGHPSFRQEAAVYLGTLRNDAGDRRGAITAWRQGVDGDSERLTNLLLHRIGTAANALGEHDTAAEAFSRVLDEQDEDHARDVAGGLGQALVAAGRIDEAREVLSRAFGDQAPFHLAPELDKAGRVAEAVAEYRTVAHHPELAGPASMNIAVLLRAHDDLPGAVAAARAAVARATGEWMAEAARTLGSLLAEAGDPAGASAAYERAALADQRSAGQSLLELGRVLEEAGELEAARSAYERAAAQEDDERAAAIAAYRLGRATPQERPWAMLAEGDRTGALAGLTELTGSASLAELLLALDADDVPEVGRLLTPGSGEDCFEETIQAARAGEDDLAHALLRLVIDRGGPVQAAKARLIVAGMLAEDGHPCRAELCLIPVTGCGDAEFERYAWKNIGVLRERRGDVDGAIEAYRAAMPGTVSQVVRLLEARGDEDGVLETLYGGADAGDLESLRFLPGHLLMRQDHERAAAMAERAVATGDTETVAMGYWTWGDVRKAEGDPAGAVVMYRKGMEAGDPDSLEPIRVDLGQALHAQGDVEGARRELWRAIESDVPDAVARAGVTLGMWSYEDGDLLGAARAFAHAAATESPFARNALTNLNAVAYQAAEQGDHALAVQVLELVGADAAGTAMDLAAECADPEAVRAYYAVAGADPYTELGLAGRLAELGESGQARAVYERLQEHDDPEIRFIAGSQALSMLDKDEDGEAIYELTARRAGDADSPLQDVFGSLLGLLQSERGDTEDSLRTLRAAAEGGAPMALSVLAQALVAAGEVDEAREAYARVAEGDDADLAARAMISIGQTYHDEDEERARAWYLRGVEAGQGHTGAVAAMYLGALAKRARDFPEALTWYQRVLDSGDSESGMAAAHLGELCYWLGDRDGALRFYELTLALTEQPDLVAEAAHRLGEIRFAHGDLATARRMLEIAVETGDAAFAPPARELLARLPYA
ncbi:tetratricopeptide repeat protein [Nonomuraea sp. NPDC049152]|uniref:tetratricopeptide repeat protein n=1 Tax=Nonomuraea sp. NPDC049152 TaxID=3154350 RepID=UPI0034053CD1